MKKIMVFLLSFVVLFHPLSLAKAAVTLKAEDIGSIKVKRASGGSRLFRENDGYEEPVIRKVIGWINAATPVKESSEIIVQKRPTAVIKLKMKNGDVAFVESTQADGEVNYIWNNKKVRLKSVELYDWLLVGWKIENTSPPKDSKEFLLNDILMVLLGADIDKAVNNYYLQYLTQTPTVYPYLIEIVKMERIGEFRTFHFMLTLETTPVVGPHISVGKDRMTFEIGGPGKVKLIKYEHLETHELPPNWQHIIKSSPTVGLLF